MNVLISLLPTILGLLGEFLSAFLTAWQAHHSADPNITSVLYGFVQSAQTNPALTTGDAKYTWVFDRMKEYLTQQGKQMADAMLNTLIELAVQKMQTLVPPTQP